MIAVSMVGVHHRHPPAFVVDRPAGLGEYLFLHLLGPAELRLGEGLVPAEAGDCFLYTPAAPQWYHGRGTGLANDWLHFSGGAVAPAVAAAGLPLDSPFRPRDTGFVAPLLSELAGEARHRDTYWPELADLLVRQLFWRLGRELVLGRSPEVTPGRVAQFERVRAVRAEMLSAVEQSWTLARLARQAGLSRSRFAAAYREFFASTPLADLGAARLRHACFLLTHDARPVAEVAERCGFGSNSHFCHVFRAHLGCTPRDYACGRR